MTRGRSDDANGYTVEGQSVGLRVSRVNRAYAFHASTDGRWWRIIRHFEIGAADAAIGFDVQSPKGDGCRASFADISVESTTLADLRDGR